MDGASGRNGFGGRAVIAASAMPAWTPKDGAHGRDRFGGQDGHCGMCHALTNIHNGGREWMGLVVAIGLEDGADGAASDASS